jgi:Flp pilus assembly protein TadG
MRLRSRRTKAIRSTATRSKQRGVAAVEFALSLILLVPVMLGIADYGYYFYIAVNVVEAQQAGALAASKVVIGDCAGGGNAALVALATTAGSTAVTNYMIAANLPSTIVTLSNTTPTCVSPASAPPSPPPLSWQFAVTADFRPAIGWVGPWMKASSTPGYVRYTARKLVMLGK